MSHRRVPIAAIIATTAMTTLAACAAGGHTSAVPVAATTTPPAETVLAIGGRATEGDGVRDRLQDAWPYLVFRESLPASTIFVNGALDDATVAQALANQTPLAKELKPTIVEVWLGADDLRADTPIAAFTSDYTRLVNTLRADGSGRILIADLPAAYGPRAAAYNAAIHAVVADTHTELVALADRGVTLEPAPGLPPQPGTAGHRIIAEAFEQQIAHGSTKVGPSG